MSTEISTDSSQKITNTIPSFNPVVYLFVLSPILDLLAGHWNFIEWSFYNTVVAAEWVSLFEKEFILGTISIITVVSEIMHYNLLPNYMNNGMMGFAILYAIFESYLIFSTHQAV